MRIWPVRAVSSNVQAAFAQIQQLHPEVGALYQDRKLWESMHADLAAMDLRRRFDVTVERQRQAIMQRAGGRFAFVFAPIRWLLTIGAVLWFPLLQPVSEALLQPTVWTFSKETLLVVVKTLSVAHFLECTTFLLLWFLILWVLLRWGMQRRVGRLIERWKQSDPEDELSLAGQTVEWIDELLEPVHRRRDRISAVIKQAEELRQQLSHCA